MTAGPTKSLSAFAQSALALDDEFNQFERLSRELERLSIHSDKGLERARALLGELDQCGQRIGKGMQTLATALDGSREQTEKAAQIVSSKSMAVQERQRETEQMLGRVKALGDMARQITTSVAQLRQPSVTDLSDADKQQIASRLPEINGQLGFLVEEARKLADDAQTANMKDLERHAQSLKQTLQAARNRLNLFVDKQVGVSQGQKEFTKAAPSAP